MTPLLRLLPASAEALIADPIDGRSVERYVRLVGFVTRQGDMG